MNNDLREDRELCYRLVKMGSAILGKSLTLTFDDKGPPRTTAGCIFLPAAGEIVTLCKHELAHHYFGSDAELMYRFVNRLLLTHRKAGTSPRLTEALTLAVNIFEDIRVEALWGHLYEGDVQKFDRLNATYLVNLQNAREFSILGWLIWKAHGAPKPFALADHPTIVALNARLGNETDTLTQQAKLTTFRGLLAHMRDYLLRLLEFLETPPEDPEASDPEDSEAANQPPFAPEQPRGTDNPNSPQLTGEQVTDALGADTRAIQEYLQGRRIQRPAPPKTLSGKAEAKKREQADALLEDVFTSPLEDLEGQEVDKALQDLGHLQTEISISRKPKTRSEDLLSEMLSPSRIKEIPEKALLPHRLSAENQAAADEAQVLFRRLLGKRKARFSEEGEDLDIEQVIAYRNREEDEPRVYSRPLPDRGFALTLLVDLSGSMERDFGEVEDLALMLQRAFAFPRVTFRVRGFTSSETGLITIVDYPKGFSGLRVRDPQAYPQCFWDLTPLPMAIDIAAKELSYSHGELNLLVLTDGLPVYSTTKGHCIRTQVLMEWTRTAVANAAHRRVQTTCFMIGNTASDESLNAMFGGGSWQRTLKGLTPLMEFAFLRFHTYLKTL